MKTLRRLSAAIAAMALAWTANASADYKTLPGAGCDDYGGTNDTTYKSYNYIYTTYPDTGYTNIYCPIVRDVETTAIKDVWVDFKNVNGTQTCTLVSSDRSGSSYVSDSEQLTINAGYDGTLRFTADSLDEWDYGAYVVACTMNTGDRLYNIYWNE